MFSENAKSKLEAVFVERTPHSSQELFVRYFANQGIPAWIVIKVKEVYQRNIDLDLSRLAPTDDFSKELRFVWDLDSMSSVQIVIDLEKELGIEITDEEAECMNTIADTIRIVASKLSLDLNEKH